MTVVTSELILGVTRHQGCNRTAPRSKFGLDGRGVPPLPRMYATTPYPFNRLGESVILIFTETQNI